MIIEFDQTSMKTIINVSIKWFQIDWWIWWKCKWRYIDGFEYNGSKTIGFFQNPITLVTYHEDNERYRNYSTKGSGKIGWKQISFLLTFKDEKIWCMTPSNNYAEMTMKISKKISIGTNFVKKMKPDKQEDGII